MTQVIVLNGASSSGKSGIARCLQAVLPDPWLTLGVDTFIQTMPPALRVSDQGIAIDADAATARATGAWPPIAGSPPASATSWISYAAAPNPPKWPRA
jgi:chloramphenicol 3-O-phosphotransferase